MSILQVGPGLQQSQVGSSNKLLSFLHRLLLLQLSLSLKRAQRCSQLIALVRAGVGFCSRLAERLAQRVLLSDAAVSNDEWD